MAITYIDHRESPPDRFETVRDEPFVPVYARTGRAGVRSRKGKLKTWMILAPLGVLIVGGAAVALMMNEGDAAPEARVLEPAATAPVLPATAPLAAASASPVTAAPVDASPTPTPTVRREAPVRRAAPAPATRATPTPAPTIQTAPLESAPTTSTLNATPAPTPTPAPTEPPPPRIIVQPLG